MNFDEFSMNFRSKPNLFKYLAVDIPACLPVGIHESNESVSRNVKREIPQKLK